MIVAEMRQPKNESASDPGINWPSLQGMLFSGR